MSSGHPPPPPSNYPPPPYATAPTQTAQPRSHTRLVATVAVVTVGLVLLGGAGLYFGTQLGPDDASEAIAADNDAEAPAVQGEPQANANEDQSTGVVSIDMESDLLSQIKPLEIRDNGDELLTDSEFLAAYLDRMNKWQMAGATQDDYDRALAALQGEGYPDPSIAEVGYKIAETHAPVFGIALFGSGYIADTGTAQAMQERIGVNAAALDQFFTAEQDSRGGVPYSSYHELGEVISTDRHKYDAGTMTFSVVQRDNAAQSGALYSVDGYIGEVTITTSWTSRGGTTHSTVNGETVTYTDTEEYGVEEIEAYSFANTDMGDDSSYVN